MQQTHAWDLDLPIPSILMAVESNLRIPLPFLYLAMAPILLSFVLSFWISQPFPSFASFTVVSVICYLLANGFVIILILISQFIFYAAAVVHIFIKTRLVGSLNHSLFTISDLKIDWLVYSRPVCSKLRPKVINPSSEGGKHCVAIQTALYYCLNGVYLCIHVCTCSLVNVLNDRNYYVAGFNCGKKVLTGLLIFPLVSFH